MELFQSDKNMVLVDQTVKNDDKRILKLTRLYDICGIRKPISFNVTSASSPHNLILFRGKLLPEYKEQKFIIENVDHGDWIKINSDNSRIHLHYSKKMLDVCFPRDENTPAVDRLNKINGILGTKIKLIQSKTLHEIFWFRQLKKMKEKQMIKMKEKQRKNAFVLRRNLVGTSYHYCHT